MRVVALNLSHDSSVCSYVDGKIEFYCKEERLSRKKRDSHPFLSLQKYAEQNFGKIDHFLYLTPSNDEPQVFHVYEEYIRKHFGIELENFSGLNHHDCHASLSFYNSGFSESLVFVIDRNGSIYFKNNNAIARESETVYLASYPDKINPIYKSFSTYNTLHKHQKKQEIQSFYDFKYGKNFLEINLNNFWGIVKVYEAATTLIGQHALENGKTMGLSSYGENVNYPPLFLNGSPISNYFTALDLSNLNFIEDSSAFFEFEDKITNNITKDNFQFYANKAKHVQIETQRESLRLIKKFVNKTGIKNVCICGGYGLNVVANNFYIKNLPDVNFYFEPLSDDSGITIGGCMLKYRRETKDSKIYQIKNNFYHFYENDKNKILGKNKNVSDLANLLGEQKIIAIFESNPESGPRALGHRSLLFDPRNINGKDIVNTLKQREWYRPFAGIILQEHFEEYFHTLGLNSSEFMTINFECKDGVKNYVPSIVHVDNTCRIQTVSDSNPFLFDLLTEFYQKTGCPMLLNTSFNLAGDPLIQTKNDVIHFMNKVKGNLFFSGTYFVDEKIFLTNNIDKD